MCPLPVNYWPVPKNECRVTVTRLKDNNLYIWFNKFFDVHEKVLYHFFSFTFFNLFWNVENERLNIAAQVVISWSILEIGFSFRFQNTLFIFTLQLKHRILTVENYNTYLSPPLWIFMYNIYMLRCYLLYFMFIYFIAQWFKNMCTSVILFLFFFILFFLLHCWSQTVIIIWFCRIRIVVFNNCIEIYKR